MTDTELCALTDLVDGAGQRFDVDGQRLAVIRIGDDVYVIGDRCTHAEASLSEGEVDVDTCHIECWRHGSSFSLRTGQPDALPATRPVPVYSARVVDGRVLVSLDEHEGASR
ncbi:MAG TPA: non-heme iron oxygenase ferredoxin subunit [Acidimicrobiales bacterium]